MRWVLKQLRVGTIQAITATPEINCKMFIDLTRQSCAASLHWYHSTLVCLWPWPPGSSWEHMLLSLYCYLLILAPGQWCCMGAWGAYPSYFRDLGAEMKHAGPELKNSLLYLVPNPPRQQEFWVMTFQLRKYLGSSPEQFSGFRGFHSPAESLAEIDYFIYSLNKYEIL